MLAAGAPRSPGLRPPAAQVQILSRRAEPAPTRREGALGDAELREPRAHRLEASGCERRGTSSTRRCGTNILRAARSNLLSLAAVLFLLAPLAEAVGQQSNAR